MPRILITEVDAKPQPYKLALDTDAVTIGRGSDNAIVVNNSSVSTHHCILERVGGGFVLKDLGSTNGIFLENTRFDTIDLTDEKTVLLGNEVKLAFFLSEEEKEALSSEEFISQEGITLPNANQVEPVNKLHEQQHVEDEDDRKKKQHRLTTETTPRAFKPKKPTPFIELLFIAAFAFMGGMALYHYHTHGSWEFWKEPVQKKAENTNQS